MLLGIWFSFFALGAIIASFVGVIVGRHATGQSALVGRSRCDACNAPLSFAALVPLVSYAVSRGRALCCHARISPYAPLSEAVLGGLFVIAYATLGFSITLPFFLVALATVFAIVLYDLAHQIIPPRFLAVLLFFAGVVAVLEAPSMHALLKTFVSAAIIALIFSAFHFFSRGRFMGFSDAPLAFALTLLVGASSALSGFLFSFWIGAVIGILVLLRRPRGSRIGVEVPFAPFLAAGFLLAYFTQWNPFNLPGLF